MKEVIILGKASSGYSCPFDAEVWGINDVCTIPPYWGKHFNKLIVTDPINPENMSQSRINEIKSYGFPIVSYHEYADETYPLMDIINEFCPANTNRIYMANGCVRAIALAIYWRYEKIRLYGIDHCDEQYIPLKGCVEYWIGRAQERGVLVEIQDESCLMKVVRENIRVQRIIEQSVL